MSIPSRLIDFADFLPDWLIQGLNFGMAYPDGDEEALFALGDAWKTAAAEIERLELDLRLATREVPQFYTGDGATAIEQEFSKLFDGEDFSIQKLMENLDQLGSDARSTATDIEYVKLQSIGFALLTLYTVGQLLATLYGSLAVPAYLAAARVALGAFSRSMIEKIAATTGRAALQTLAKPLSREIAIPLGEQIVTRGLGQQVARNVAQQALTREQLAAMALKGAKIGGMLGAGSDAVIQGLQISAGHRDDGFDVGQVIRTGIQWGAGGAVGAPVHGLLGSRISNALGSRMSNQKISSMLSGGLSGGLAGAAGGIGMYPAGLLTQWQQNGWDWSKVDGTFHHQLVTAGFGMGALGGARYGLEPGGHGDGSAPAHELGDSASGRNTGAGSRDPVITTETNAAGERLFRDLQRQIHPDILGTHDLPANVQKHFEDLGRDLGQTKARAEEAGGYSDHDVAKFENVRNEWRDVSARLGDVSNATPAAEHRAGPANSTTSHSAAETRASTVNQPRPTEVGTRPGGEAGTPREAAPSRQPSTDGSAPRPATTTNDHGTNVVAKSDDRSATPGRAPEVRAAPITVEPETRPVQPDSPPRPVSTAPEPASSRAPETAPPTPRPGSHPLGDHPPQAQTPSVPSPSEHGTPRASSVDHTPLDLLSGSERPTSLRLQIEAAEITSISPSHTDAPTPSYEARRLGLDNGEHLTLLTVRVHLDGADLVPPAHVREITDNLHDATNREFNDGQRLLGGDHLRVELEFTTDPAAAQLHATLDVPHSDAAPHTWTRETPSEVLTQQLREQLGLATEAAERTLTPGDIRRLSDDIRYANTPNLLSGLPETRVIAPNKLGGLEHPTLLDAVKDAVSGEKGFVIGADPRTFGETINGPGSHAPGRSTNCIENSLAGLSTFYGDPQVAHPVWSETAGDGTLVAADAEYGGFDRAEQWLGKPWETFGWDSETPVVDQFAWLHDHINQLGEMSAALLTIDYHSVDYATNQYLYDHNNQPISDFSHSVVVLYPRDGEGPVWCDFQHWTFSETPPIELQNDALGIWFIETNPQELVGGIDGAGHLPHGGTSGTVPGTPLPSGHPIQPLSERVRLGLPSDSPGTRTESPGQTPPSNRQGDIRPERPDRSVDHPREHAATHDRSDVRPSDQGRETRARPADLSLPVEGERPTNVGGREHDRVPGDGRIPERAIGTDRGAPAEHHQAPLRSSDQQPGGRGPGVVQPGGILGDHAPTNRPDLAGARDVRLLDGNEPGVVSHTSEPVHRVETVEDGKQLGESLLGPIRDTMAENELRALQKYTNTPIINELLRAADTGELLREFAQDFGHRQQLMILTDGVPITPKISVLDALAEEPHLDPRLRAAIDSVLDAPMPFQRLDALFLNADKWVMLREYFGTEPTIEAFREQVSLIDHAANRRVPEGISVVRGVTVNGLDHLTINDQGTLLNGRNPLLLENTVQTEAGYLSTSLAPVPPQEFHRGIRIELDVPADSVGVYVGKKSGVGDEGEFLLQRLTRYLITEVIENPQGPRYDGVEYLIKGVVVTPDFVPDRSVLPLRYTESPTPTPVPEAPRENVPDTDHIPFQLSLGEPATPVSTTPAVRAPDPAPPYRVERTVDAAGEPITELTVNVHLAQPEGVTDIQMRQIADRAWGAADQIFRPGEGLFGEEPARVMLRFVADPAMADLLARADHAGEPGRQAWPVDAPAELLAQRIREHLDLPPVTNVDTHRAGLPETRVTEPVPAEHRPPRPTPGALPGEPPSAGSPEGNTPRPIQQDNGAPAGEPSHREPSTPGRVERYLDDPYVTDALSRADDRGSVAKIAGVEMPVGDAVRTHLPQHPELAGLLRETPYLEASLMERPKALASLLAHPEAIPVLSEATHTVTHQGPESVLAEPVQVTATPLTSAQQAISRVVQDSVSDLRASDRRQPGFDQSRQEDPAYQAEFLRQQYDLWPTTQEALNDVVRDIAERTGGEPGWRTDPKDEVRAWDKVRGYEGDVSRLTDLVGAKVVFDRVSDAYRALELIEKDPRLEIVDFDDRFATPQPSGYRDLQMKVQMPNGHIAELRLHLSHVDEVAVYEHALFEVQRDFKSLAEQQGRELTPDERALRTELQRRLNELFWDATKKGLPDEFPPDTGRRPEDPGPEPDGPTPGPVPDDIPPRPLAGTEPHHDSSPVRDNAVQQQRAGLAEPVESIASPVPDASAGPPENLPHPWPADPINGYPIQARDLEFLGLTHEQIEAWMAREAPLGMTPDTYQQWRSSLLEALHRDGIDITQVDIRLRGSAADFFSGVHKQLPTIDKLSDHPEAHTRLQQWLGEDPARPVSRPFDSMHKLGLEEPSDFDINISSTEMYDRARTAWDEALHRGPLSKDHGYLNKDLVKFEYPHLRRWAEEWGARTDRDMSYAVFDGTGPKDVSHLGFFVHFQETDWIVHRPGASVDRMPWTAEAVKSDSVAEQAWSRDFSQSIVTDHATVTRSDVAKTRVIQSVTDHMTARTDRLLEAARAENVNPAMYSQLGNSNYVVVLHNPDFPSMGGTLLHHSQVDPNQPAHAPARLMPMDVPHAERTLREMAVSELIMAWAHDSNGTNVKSLAIQDAAAAEFILRDVLEWRMTEELRTEVQREVAAYGDIHRELLRVQYEQTQRWLSREGVNNLVLYRGYSWKEANFPEWARQPSGAVLDLPPQRPLSAWTGDRHVAASWLTEHELPGVILAARFPREAVVAFPQTGIGCLWQIEFVVLSGQGSATLDTVHRPDPPAPPSGTK